MTILDRSSEYVVYFPFLYNQHLLKPYFETVKWPDWLEDIHTNDLSFRGYAMHEIMPVLTRNGIPLAICPEGQLVCSESGPVPPLYLKLAKDPEFRAILTVRRIMMWNSAQDLENARAEADKILALIRSQIDVTD